MKTLCFLVSLGMVLIDVGAVCAAETHAASRQIDALLAEGWKKHDIKGNEKVSDEVFVRRAYLTVVGRIPTPAETVCYLDSSSKNKKGELIDQLLSSEGYVHHFFNYWADVLRAQSQGVGDGTTAQNYLNFIRDSLRTNKPYDRFVRELIASEGACFDNAAIGYYMRDRGMPLDNLSNTTRVFLGTRMECAQCHDHPFDKWTQKQFYQMAAFTHNMSATSYRSAPQEEVQKMIRADKSLSKEMQDLMRQALSEVNRPLRDTLVVQNKTALRLPHDYKYTDSKPKDVVQASVMFGKPVTLTKESSPISEFSQWLASSSNPRFTNLIANRLWKKVFGLALIEPLDELMDTSAASNPELMRFLENQMVALKYDMKAYLKMILNTEAFSRASTHEVAPGAPYYFQGPVFRRMSAEQMWDSLVTLVNPLPDQENWSAREREKKDLETRRGLAALLDKTEAALVFAAAKEVALAMVDQNKVFDGLRKELDVARAKNDKDASREIQRRLGESQRVLRQTVSRCFYEAAAKSGNNEVLSRLAAIGGDGPMEMAMMNAMEGSRVDPRDRPLNPALVKIVKADATVLGLKDAKSLKSYENYQRTLHQTWVRAAELPSPAPRGHFLREFGQSDRNVIENSSDEASVPQALTIMNGSLVTQMAGPWSLLSINLRKAQTVDEKVDVLFLSLYSRLPQAREKALIYQTLEEAGGSKTIWEDLTVAALSTQRFLFIE